MSQRDRREHPGRGTDEARLFPWPWKRHAQSHVPRLNLQTQALCPGTVSPFCVCCQRDNPTVSSVSLLSLQRGQHLTAGETTKSSDFTLEALLVRRQSFATIDVRSTSGNCTWGYTHSAHSTVVLAVPPRNPRQHGEQNPDAPGSCPTFGISHPQCYRILCFLPRDRSAGVHLTAGADHKTGACPGKSCPGSPVWPGNSPDLSHPKAEPGLGRVKEPDSSPTFLWCPRAELAEPPGQDQVTEPEVR